MTAFDGLELDLGSLSRLSSAVTRSISAENPTGAPNAGGRATEGVSAPYSQGLGPGWKVSPAIGLSAGETVSIAEIEGPGAIQHIWMTVLPRYWRSVIVRCFWDDEPDASIEVPIGDLFCSGWGTYAQVSSIPISVNPAGGFNSYWQMPFRKGARITVENVGVEDIEGFFYQITYTATEVPEDRAYLHAQYRRANPVAKGEPYTILDGVRGRGHFVGVYLAWGANNSGWWGEGEIKFYLDGDEHPTICGTGTEDYFGGAWGFEHPAGQYAEYTTPYLGMPQVIRPDGFHSSQQRFGLYRWHIQDPIRFTHDLRVTIQALGWRTDPPFAGRPRFLPLQDDLASTAWWYQAEPHGSFPPLPHADDLEAV